MSNLQGAIFFTICVIFAVVDWVLNVVYIDNALPQVLNAIVAALPNPIVDMTWWAHLFIKLAEMAPLFMVVVGAVGWFALSTLYGRRDVQYQ